MTKRLEHRQTEALRDAIVEIVLEICKDDERLTFEHVDRAFSLAWSDIEDEYIERDYDE
jgi:hypothetical protein